MINVNQVYKSVLVVLQQEKRGVLTPVEFNKIATTSQQEIYMEYFDELNQLLRQPQTSLAYADRYALLDEKIQKSEDFQNQRKRWLSTQSVYFRKYFLSGIKELFLKGNLNFFDKVYQMISPPRILLLGIVSIITLVYGMIDIFQGPIISTVSPRFWYLILIITVLAFIMAIPFKFYTRKTLKAILMLPKAFLLMFFLLFKLKGANNKFIHTKHGAIKS